VIRRVDRYELLEQVGSGGMAVVYRGRDTALDREVAVKVLHPHLAARAESRARFSREARAVARLSHPNIVEIYDYAGDAALESYLVTEFVHGRTLRAFAEQEGVGFPEVGALLVRALSDALVHAHAAEVIHRDLKPENVLVLESGGRRAVKLVDFGIARILSSDDRMTMTGALVGSPNHMAPEIIEGLEADARCDVFSLGTILYWLATGKMPFAAPNPTATLRRVIQGEFADPREVNPLVSDPLAAVMKEALSADPARRTPSAAALRTSIDAALRAGGLQDPPAELEAFLADPARYKRELGARLLAFARAEADRSLEAGQTARGMKFLDRVLALHPGDEAVQARLRRLSARARWRTRTRRASRVLAGLLLLVGIAWAGITLRRSRPLPSAPEQVSPAEAEVSAPPPLSAPPPTPPPAAAAVGPRAALPAAPAPVPPPARSGAAAREPPVVARSDPAPSPAPVTLSIHVSPYAQRALLDGVEVARGEGQVTFSLLPGVRHRIQIEHACCFPFVKDFAADEAIPAELKERLRPRPARLRVEGDPKALVYVEGKLVGTAGDSQRSPLPVPVPVGGESPYEAPAQLRLESDGRAPVLATVRLRAGVDVTFAASRDEGRSPSGRGPTVPSSESSP